MSEENQDPKENQTDSNFNTEEIKKEAAETVNQVKDTIKNTDFKKDANEAKGFFSKLWKEPIKTMENVTHSSQKQFLKIAIIVFVIWLVASFLSGLISIFNSLSYYSVHYGTFASFFKDAVSNILAIVKIVITPILSVGVLSAIIYFMLKEKKKPFITIATAVVVAKIPVVLASVISLLEIFSSQFYKITSMFSGICSVISTVLLFFVIKSFYGEKDEDKSMKSFVIIMAIFYVIRFIFSFLGIYL